MGISEVDGTLSNMLFYGTIRSWLYELVHM